MGAAFRWMTIQLGEWSVYSLFDPYYYSALMMATRSEVKGLPNHSQPPTAESVNTNLYRLLCFILCFFCYEPAGLVWQSSASAVEPRNTHTHEHTLIQTRPLGLNRIWFVEISGRIQWNSRYTLTVFIVTRTACFQSQTSRITRSNKDHHERCELESDRNRDTA